MQPARALIYSGWGTHQVCIKGHKNIFAEFLPDLPVEEIDNFEEVINKVESYKDLSLLVIPGGKSGDYENDFRRLKPIDQEKFLQMEKKGKLVFWGTCAGAYFLSRRYSGSAVYKGEKMDFQSRDGFPLGVFPPVRTAFEGFVSNSREGARIVELFDLDHCMNPEIPKWKISWNGGPKMTAEAGYDTIAYYLMPGECIAIQAKPVLDENGNIIYSSVIGGPHLETRDNIDGIFNKEYREILCDEATRKNNAVIIKKVLKRFGFVDIK
jgi:glutamine amidotransferase-like uncharacterized protein